MIELLATNSLLRSAILAALFVLVAGVTYMIAGAAGARRLARHRLLADASDVAEPAILKTSIRAEQTNTAWAKLVDRIEKSGLSLVDTKDLELRRKLAAAGFTASYAPRAYTLLRLTLVIGLPILVTMLLWISGSAPGLLKLWQCGEH